MNPIWEIIFVIGMCVVCFFSGMWVVKNNYEIKSSVEEFNQAVVDDIQTVVARNLPKQYTHYFIDVNGKATPCNIVTRQMILYPDFPTGYVVIDYPDDHDKIVTFNIKKSLLHKTMTLEEITERLRNEKPKS